MAIEGLKNEVIYKINRLLKNYNHVFHTDIKFLLVQHQNMDEDNLN
jgi:hypothetical protein